MYVLAKIVMLTASCEFSHCGITFVGPGGKGSKADPQGGSWSLSLIQAQKNKLLQKLNFVYDHETFTFCRTSQNSIEAEESHNSDANHEMMGRGGRQHDAQNQ